MLRVILVARRGIQVELSSVGHRHAPGLFGLDVKL